MGLISEAASFFRIDLLRLTLAEFSSFLTDMSVIQILIGKLEHYVVRGIASSLIASYFTNRKQYTVNNE